MSNMGLGTHHSAGCRSLMRDPLAATVQHPNGDYRVMIKGSSARWTTSALDTKPLEPLVEAGQLSTAVDQPLLSAGPGRMRLRVDVEAQCVSWLAVGRARLIRG